MTRGFPRFDTIAVALVARVARINFAAGGCLASCNAFLIMLGRKRMPIRWGDAHQR